MLSQSPDYSNKKRTAEEDPIDAKPAKKTTDNKLDNVFVLAEVFDDDSKPLLVATTFSHAHKKYIEYAEGLPKDYDAKFSIYKTGHLFVPDNCVWKNGDELTAEQKADIEENKEKEPTGGKVFLLYDYNTYFDHRSKDGKSDSTGICNGIGIFENVNDARDHHGKSTKNCPVKKHKEDVCDCHVLGIDLNKIIDYDEIYSTAADICFGNDDDDDEDDDDQEEEEEEDKK